MKHICNKLTLILLLAISQDITQCFSCALLVIATYRSLAREVMGVILYSAQLFFFFCTASAVQAGERGNKLFRQAYGAFRRAACTPK